MVDKALGWLRRHQAFAPDKPFLMYWAPGAAHGPHHIFKEWADKYKGKFDEGWDAYRERVFARQKKLGWIPPETKLTPRADTMASWDSIPASERPFQRRLMEVFAGFVEHADAQVGRLVDGIDISGCATTPSSFIYSATTVRAPRGRTAPSASSRAEPDPEHDRAAACGARPDRRPRRARHGQGRQHVPCRVGLGRRTRRSATPS